MELSKEKSSHTQEDLSKENDTWWLEISHHLGAIYPFYAIEAPEDFSLDIEHIIHKRKKRGGVIELDPVGIVCKTCLPFLLGDRTLVKNIYRAPWMTHYKGQGKWTKANLPSHGHVNPDPVEFVNRLKKALIEEAAKYIRNAKSVGILLSGGMDSRVVAGVVRELQISSGFPDRVIAITWGQPESRDVIYASRIAERFGWERQLFTLDAATLLENIETAGRMGAEVSPLHLHAIPKIPELGGVDVILAGSYGDSVGRAEFSGRRVDKLKPILSMVLDRFGLLRTSVLKETLSALREDAFQVQHLVREAPSLRQHEIEQEAHYMRRMLQACMVVIAKGRRFYQMFTAPSVFGLMWSLDPKIRNNDWYGHLLKILPGDLLEIPWARTGRIYLKHDSAYDQTSRLYHEYGVWLRNDLRDLVVDRVNGSIVRGLGIFNDHGLDNALKVWKMARTKTTNALDEVMSWLSSLHVFVERNDLVLSGNYERTVKDRMAAIKGWIHSEAYVLARNYVRE